MTRDRKHTRKQRVEACNEAQLQAVRMRASTGFLLRMKKMSVACLCALTTLARALRPERSAAKLCLRHTVPLGEKRFVAVVDFEGERFLIGSASHSVSLLARLKPRDSAEEQFHEMFRAASTQELMIQ